VDPVNPPRTVPNSWLDWPSTVNILQARFRSNQLSGHLNAARRWNWSTERVRDPRESAIGRNTLSGELSLYDPVVPVRALKSDRLRSRVVRMLKRITANDGNDSTHFALDVVAPSGAVADQWVRRHRPRFRNS
jgi:hypothetical protein